jgi:purine-binding chemotaxis protein CheW
MHEINVAAPAPDLPVTARGAKSSASPKEPEAANQKESQFLTFLVGEEEYGVDILQVQEVKGFSAITPIPNAPDYVRGVMNLRGTIIPVADIRARFGLGRADYNQLTVIVVVTINTKTVGLMVDAVSDVLNIPANEIQPPPDFGEAVRSIYGLARSGEKVIMLLDLERILLNMEAQQPELVGQE